MLTPDAAGRLNCGHPQALKQAILETAELPAIARQAIVAVKASSRYAFLVPAATDVAHGLAALRGQLLRGDTDAVERIAESLQSLLARTPRLAPPPGGAVVTSGAVIQLHGRGPDIRVCTATEPR